MSESLPRSLDVRALADAGTTLTGSASLDQFPRLADLAAESQADATLLQSLGLVRWTAQFSLQRVTGAVDQPGLHLTVDAQLPLECQRCITPYAQALHVDREFVFAADEATAQLLDEDSDVDVLVSSRQFDLVALIEDELLMDTPIVPMHEQCPTTVAMQAGEVEEAAERPNPFAALAALKGADKKPGGSVH